MRKRGFRSHGIQLELRLDDVERTVMGQLLDQLIELIEPAPTTGSEDPLAAAVGIAEEANRPTDPALQRLFPDAYRDDEAAATDFRRYTETSLRTGKRATAQVAHSTLDWVDGKGVIRMSPEQGLAWLQSLNDLRLTVGTRLGVTQEWAEEPENPSAALYDWLTWLQSTCIDAMDGLG